MDTHRLNPHDVEHYSEVLNTVAHALGRVVSLYVADGESFRHLSEDNN